MQEKSKTRIKKWHKDRFSMRRLILLFLPFLSFIYLLILYSCCSEPSFKTKKIVLSKNKNEASEEAIAVIDKSSFTTIEEIFNSPNTKWIKQGTIPQAKFINNHHQSGYQFTCDFSQVKDRCIWDVENINIDLSQKSFISFNMDITAPSAIRAFTLYLCFSGEWIYPPIKIIEGQQKVIIDLNSEEFLELKKSPLTAVRISPWKANNNIAKITIFNVKSGSGEMLIVPNEVWYKKEEQVVSIKEFDLDTIKTLKFKNYSASSHLFLIGKPVRLIINKGVLKIPNDISIQCQDYPIDESLKKLIKKYATSPNGINKIEVNCRIDPDLSISGKVLSENLKRFNSEEAYYLNIKTNSITLIGRSQAGILRGLASIALLGSSQKSKKEKIINCSEIWQAPSVNIRMYEGGNQPTMQKRREIVDLLYLLGYNAHTMQLLGYVGSKTAFPFDSLPGDLRPINGNKEDWKKLMQYYKSRGIEFVPKMFSFSRAGIILSRPEYKDLAETAGLNQSHHKSNKNNKNFCSSNPKSYELIFSLLNELIDTLHPKTIHVGLDEVMMGNLTCEHCPSSKKKSDWLKTVIVKTHKFLKSKGVEMLMYGDVLDPYHHGYQIGINDWKFAEELPKDIIIADWKYDIRDEYQSISKFIKLGFKTIGAPWDEPENWFGIIKELINDNAYGLCGTSWGSIYPSNPYSSRTATLSLGASLCWSPSLKSMSELPVQPVSKIYKQIAYKTKMELPYARNVKHISINNNILTDAKLAEAIGFPLVYDFNSIIANTTNYRGISFNSFNNKTKMSAMILLPKTAPAKIQIGKKAKNITFLHGTNRMKDENGNAPYVKYRNSHSGKYIIRYENGEPEEIRMEYLKHITGWNSRMLASFVETGVFGSIGDKIHLNIPSYTWINPFPDRSIREIEVVPSNHKDFTLVLYGLSIDN